MTTMTADQVLLDKLRAIVEPVEILDPEGKMVGTYTPALSPEEEEAYRKAEALFDPEELDRIEHSEEGWGTIEDIRRRFDELEKRG